MAEAFIAYCETLWLDWLAGRIDSSSFSSTGFDLEAAPEPYLPFGVGSRPLVALTTNPGATMAHQRLDSIRAGKGPLRSSTSYAAAAAALATFYQQNLTGAAAHRIRALRVLSSLSGYDGVLQVEAIPFHSPTMPKKTQFLRTVSERDLLGVYTGMVRAFLQPRPVVMVSAVSSKHSLGPATELAPWAAHLASLAGLVLGRARLISLVTKGSRTTAAALVTSESGAPKALVLMMGGNHLPAEKGLRLLAAALR